MGDLFEEIRRGFAEQKGGIDGLEIKLESLRVDLKAGLQAGDASTKVDLTKWIVGAIVLNLLGTAGLMITLIRANPH